MKKLIIGSLVILSLTACSTIQQKQDESDWQRSIFYLSVPIIKDKKVESWKYYPTLINVKTHLIKPDFKEEEKK